MKLETAIVALVLKLYQSGQLVTPDNVTGVRVSDDFKRMLRQVLKTAKE